jgi:thioesterase domain-containing protein
MERRTFLGVIAGGLLAAPLAAEAQQTRKVWRIGMLDRRQPGAGRDRLRGPWSTQR